MRPYIWVITRDFINDGAGNIGVMGPADGDRTMMDHWRIPGTLWRLYDDDGTLYYEGLTYATYWDDETDFAPLDNFGMPNDGCTEIRYLNEFNNTWETL